MFILPLQGNKGYLPRLHDKQKLFCMKKILAPTDFSVNSKSGLRFAIHWATQQKMELLLRRRKKLLAKQNLKNSYPVSIKI